MAITTDWQTLTTSFVEPGNAGTFTGFLIVTCMHPRVTLSLGGVLEAFRYKYTVTAGQALQSDGGTLMLPITSDATPANARLYLTLVDANGRMSDYGYAIITRPAADANPYPTLLLSSFVTLN